MGLWAELCEGVAGMLDEAIVEAGYGPRNVVEIRSGAAMRRSITTRNMFVLRSGFSGGGDLAGASSLFLALICSSKVASALISSPMGACGALSSAALFA